MCYYFYLNLNKISGIASLNVAVWQSFMSLCLCSVQPTLSSVSRVVTHDVPVDVIPRRLWHEFKEPSMPDFDVSEECCEMKY